MVAGQVPDDALLRELRSTSRAGQRVVALGDCLAPATIASAVYAGHRFARNLHLDLEEQPDFLREDVALASLGPGQHALGAEAAR